MAAGRVPEAAAAGPRVQRWNFNPPPFPSGVGATQLHVAMPARQTETDLSPDEFFFAHEVHPDLWPVQAVVQAWSSRPVSQSRNRLLQATRHLRKCLRVLPALAALRTTAETLLAEAEKQHAGVCVFQAAAEAASAAGSVGMVATWTAPGVGPFAVLLSVLGAMLGLGANIGSNCLTVEAQTKQCREQLCAMISKYPDHLASFTGSLVGLRLPRGEVARMTLEGAAQLLGISVDGWCRNTLLPVSELEGMDMEAAPCGLEASSFYQEDEVARGQRLVQQTVGLITAGLHISRMINAVQCLTDDKSLAAGQIQGVLADIDLQLQNLKRHRDECITALVTQHLDAGGDPLAQPYGDSSAGTRWSFSPPRILSTPLATQWSMTPSSEGFSEVLLPVDVFMAYHLGEEMAPVRAVVKSWLGRPETDEKKFLLKAIVHVKASCELVHVLSQTTDMLRAVQRQSVAHGHGVATAQVVANAAGLAGSAGQLCPSAGPFVAVTSMISFGVSTIAKITDMLKKPEFAVAMQQCTEKLRQALQAFQTHFIAAMISLARLRRPTSPCSIPQLAASSPGASAGTVVQMSAEALATLLGIVLQGWQLPDARSDLGPSLAGYEHAIPMGQQVATRAANVAGAALRAWELYDSIKQLQSGSDADLIVGQALTCAERNMQLIKGDLGILISLVACYNNA